MLKVKPTESRKEPLSKRGATYGYWAGINLIAFAILYPLINWFTSWREQRYRLFWPVELEIPFVPQWIWLYFSINLLFLLPPFVLATRPIKLLGIRFLAATFIASVIFVLLPAQLGFVRLVPNEHSYNLAFGSLFGVDGPHNLVPSLHVAYATLCVVSLHAASRHPVVRAIWWVWLVMIVVSTVLVHQHHVLDVVTGEALVAILCCLIREPRGVRANRKLTL